MISGVVIAGFGRKDFVPALAAYEFEEMVLGFPRWRRLLTRKIGGECGAVIQPFAQKEPVDQFMRGIAPWLHDNMRATTEKVVTKAIELILGKLSTQNVEWSTTLSETIFPEISDILGKLFGDWQEQQKIYWSPFLPRLWLRRKMNLVTWRKLW